MPKKWLITSRKSLKKSRMWRETEKTSHLMKQPQQRTVYRSRNWKHHRAVHAGNASRPRQISRHHPSRRQVKPRKQDSLQVIRQ